MATSVHTVEEATSSKPEPAEYAETAENRPAVLEEDAKTIASRGTPYQLVQLTIEGTDITRWMLARKQNAAHEAACKLLGPAKTFKKLLLRDRKNLRPTLVAYAKPLNGKFLAMLAGSNEARLVEKPEDIFGDLPNELDPETVYDFGHAGTRLGFRHEFCCGCIERYEPITQEEREKRSVNRKRRAAEREEAKWREEHPLFAAV